MSRRHHIEPVVARVRCQGKLHRVELTRRGHLVLRDHPDHRVEDVMEHLGGQACRCREIMARWLEIIKGDKYERLEPDSRCLRDLPRPLREPAYEAAKLRRRRQIRLTDAYIQALADGTFRGLSHINRYTTYGWTDWWTDRLKVIGKKLEPQLQYTNKKGESLPVIIDNSRLHTGRLECKRTSAELVAYVDPMRFLIGYHLTGGVLYEPTLGSNLLCMGTSGGFRLRHYDRAGSLEVVAAHPSYTGPVARFNARRRAPYQRGLPTPMLCRAQKRREGWKILAWSDTPYTGTVYEGGYPDS